MNKNIIYLIVALIAVVAIATVYNQKKPEEIAQDSPSASPANGLMESVSAPAADAPQGMPAPAEMPAADTSAVPPAAAPADGMTAPADGMGMGMMPADGSNPADQGVVDDAPVGAETYDSVPPVTNSEPAAPQQPAAQ